MKSIVLCCAFLTLGVLFGADDGGRAKALELHRRFLTVDTHCDTPFLLLLPGWDIGQRHEPGRRDSGRQDLVRMKEGGLDASFFAVFVGQGECTPEGRKNAYDEAVQILDALDAMYGKHPALVGKALTPADAYRLKKQGKRAIFIGMENGYPLGLDLSLVDYFHNRGVRYITLAHTADNDICDSSTDKDEPQDKGLSAFGRRLVERMNELGIMVDVSHISDKSFYDVLAMTKTPVLASHSCARALCDNPRNLSDEMLLALKKNGGVIQLCVLGEYVKRGKPNPERDAAFKTLRQKIKESYGSWGNIKDPAVRDRLEAEFAAVEEKYPADPVYVRDAVDHIDHIVKLIGIDHVGIGTDFDGGGGLTDCSDVTELYRFTVELQKRGYKEAEIAKIWGGNAMRVMTRVQEYAAKMRKKGKK